MRSLTQRKVHGTFGILALALLLAGCETPTVAVSARLPARYPAAAELRKATVAGFDGPGGNSFAATLEAQLATIQFDGARYFTVMGGARNTPPSANVAAN